VPFDYRLTAALPGRIEVPKSNPFGFRATGKTAIMNLGRPNLLDWSAVAGLSAGLGNSG
jgi:hypothetical protein